jgi:transposase
MGKRGVSRLFGDLFGLPLSPAMVCKLQHRTAEALRPVAEEALTYTRGQPANVDETGWKEGRTRAWLWVAVTTLVVAFLIRKTRGRSAFDDLRDGSEAVHTTDRYPVYTHLDGHRRQVCWAHLRRDFQAMIDRDSAGSAIGEDLLIHADILLRHWKRVRDGTLSRPGFRRTYLGWIRVEVHTLLERGAACGCAQTAGVCRELLSVEPGLYTFAVIDEVEPTNNAAERALRHAVCWRKTSFGTDSQTGSRFVERVLTVVASCRQQSRDVLEFLTAAIQTAKHSAPPPSLIPPHASTL